MAEWTIYGKNGVAKASVKELELHDEWMAECFITVSVKSAAPIDFSVGDYIDYRNERYSINYDPSKIKKARRNTYGEGFVYDNIKFVAVQDELVRCDFCDIVLSDNQMHYTQLPTFPFYCETVDDLLDRIQANMEELYPGQWIIISPDIVRDSQRGLCVGREQAFIDAYNQYIGEGSEYEYEKTGVALTVDNINCWEALAKAHNDFLLDFITRGRTVIVGTAGVFTSNKFRYGKGNGLYEIEVVGDSEQKVVTRLRAYGSEQNLPERYYSTKGGRPFFIVTEIPSGSSTEHGISVMIDNDRYYNVFNDEAYEVSSSQKMCYGSCEMDGIVFDAVFELLGQGGTTCTTRMLVSADGYPVAPYIEGHTVPQSVIDALKSAMHVGSQIIFNDGVNISYVDKAHIIYSDTELPENMAVNRLMLPGFPDMSLDAWVRANRPELIDEGFTFSTNSVRPYIDSPNKDLYDIRPSNIFFDGSNETDEIYPTIEGMTWEGHACDVVVSADIINDNGVLPENAKESEKRVTITIPYAGFDMDKKWTEESTISMKDGMCGARDFKILKKPTQDNNGNWVCVCERAYDSTLHLYFPYSDFQIHSGDHFVLTGIELPESYVDAASIRLFDAAMDALRKNHLPRVTFQPKIDHIWMARQHDTAMASGGVVKSLHDTLKAGDYFSFADSDLGIDTDIIIDILTIKENGDNGIPTYEITLRDEKQVSTFEKRLEKIASSASSGAGGGGNINTRQIGSLVEQYGRDLFLSKIDDDKAQGFITFLKGQQIGERFTTGLLGEGGVFRKDADGTTYIEADKLYIRMKAYFDTVEIREYIHSGGNRIASVAGVKCVRVEWLGSNGKALKQRDENLSSVVKFRCYFRGSDDEKEITNDFVIGDQAYCHITNVESHSSLYQHHYWRLVIGKSTEANDDGEHYIDLSNVMSNTIGGVAYAGYQNGSDIPVPQDDVIQLGNVNDGTRRGAIIEFVSGENAPSYQIFQDLGLPVGTTIEEKQVSQYLLENKNFISLGYNSQTGHADMNVFGDFRFGSATDNGSYIKYSQDNGELEVKAKVTILPNSTYEGLSADDFVKQHYSLDPDDVKEIMQDDIEVLQNQIDGAIDTWFYDFMPVASVDSKIPLTNKEPYKTWYETDKGGTAQETDTERLKHVGDVFYDNKSGYAFRFSRNESTHAFEWINIEDSAVIKALENASKAQSTADGKSTIFLDQPTKYSKGDQWLLQSKTILNGITYPKGTLLTASNGSDSFVSSHWSEQVIYTDDSQITDFVNITYAADQENLQNQIDGKYETWFYKGVPTLNNLPASNWNTAKKKKDHLGDLYWDKTNKHAYRFVVNGSTYSWEQIGDNGVITAMAEASVAQETADGKRRVFVAQPTTPYDIGDLWAQGASGDIMKCKTARTSGSYNASDWEKASKYTDDTYAHGFDFLTSNLARLNQTEIDGGLVLTSLIGLRDSNNNIQSGINGIIQSQKKGYGIAAWYGGEQGDSEDKSHYSGVSRWAKSLFRFDGSGYLASGNITWDENGIVTIANVYSKVDGENIPWSGTSLQYINQISTLLPTKYVGGVYYIDPKTSFTKLQIVRDGASAIGDTDVLTYSEMKNYFITTSFFNRLFRAYNGTTLVNANDTTSTIDNIKAMFGFWTEAYISALGKGTGGGDITLNEPLLGINGAALGRPSTANVGIVWNGSAWVYGAVGTGSGTVTQVKVGTTAYDPVNGVVSLPAYPTVPTKLSQLTNDSGYALTSQIPTDYWKTGDSRTANRVLAAPDGSNGAATFRHLVSADIYTHSSSNAISNDGTEILTSYNSAEGFANETYGSRIYRRPVSSLWAYIQSKITAADIPDISADKITSGTLPIARGGTGATSAFAAIENLGGLSLASRGTHIPDNADLNTYTSVGKYYCSNYTDAKTLVNPPTTGSGFTLIVYVNYSTSRLIQKAFLSNHNTRFRYTDDSGSTWSAWRTFAYTDSDISGNAATATALATSRTIWGQSFNGTGNVSGNMTGVGSIGASGDISITRTTTTASNFIATNSKGSVSLKTSTNRGVYDESTEKWIITTNGTNTWLNCGNVAIDSSANTTYKLWVNGTIGNNDDVTMYNDKGLMLRDTGGTAREAVKMSTSDNLRIGYGTRAAGSTYIYGTSIYFRYGASGSSTAIYVNSSGNVGVGTTSPSEKFHVSGVIFASTGIYSNGYVSSLGQNTSSDIRLKDVKDEQAVIDIRQIADAPAIHYTWKDRKDLGVQVGSIAQYWQGIMPEAVHQTKDGSLTMQYDVIALLVGISTARKVVDHERRILELERENKELKLKLNIE